MRRSGGGKEPEEAERSPLKSGFLPLAMFKSNRKKPGFNSDPQALSPAASPQREFPATEKQEIAPSIAN